MMWRTGIERRIETVGCLFRVARSCTPEHAPDRHHFNGMHIRGCHPDGDDVIRLIATPISPREAVRANRIETPARPLDDGAEPRS